MRFNVKSFMYEYLKRHKKFVNDRLEKEGKGYDWEGLRIFHEKQIGFIQHERLIHMFIMLFVALFLLLSVFATLFYSQALFMWVLDVMLLVLLIPYIIHYFHLENGVQYYYYLSNRIDGKCGRITADYDK